MKPLGRTDTPTPDDLRDTAPRFVRGHIEVVRNGVRERMTFTTFDGLVRLVEQLREAA